MVALAVAAHSAVDGDRRRARSVPRPRMAGAGLRADEPAVPGAAARRHHGRKIPQAYRAHIYGRDRARLARASTHARGSTAMSRARGAGPEGIPRSEEHTS